jgi:septum formation protein
MRLVLASQSPRRRELLASVGLEVAIRPAHADESVRPGEAPEAYVRRVARDKAEGVAAAPGELVLAADTAVVLDGAILGKPADDGEARRMLRALSGRTHVVLTGVHARALPAAGVPPREGSELVAGVAGSVTNVVGLPLAETLALLARLGLSPPWDRSAA